MFRISFIFLFIFLIGNGQEKSYPEIDSALSSNFNKTNMTERFEEGLKITQQLIKKSRQLKYKAGIGQGYIDIANFLYSLNRSEEGLKYLVIAENVIITTNNNVLKANLYTEFGNIYIYLGLQDTALEYYNKSIYFAKKTNDIYIQQDYQQRAYSNISYAFGSLGKIDSAYVYAIRSYKEIPNPFAAIRIAEIFINYKKNKLDSAAYYLKIADDSLRLYHYEPFCKLTFLVTKGDFYFEKKEYEKALDYYYKNLELVIQNNDKDGERITYKLISNTYKALKDGERSAEYLRKYTIINDSLNSLDKKALNKSVDKLMKDKEEEKIKIQYNSLYVFIIIFCIAFILIIFACIFYKRKKKEKELLIQNQQEEITQNKIEKRGLEYRINDAFEEVVQLARKNDPSFLARFKEVYPEFCERLLSRYPHMVNSELTFCAYLKLNLSTKEIANYTFVTNKAIEARKSRFRKKMNIGSEEDLYIWINKI